MKRQSLLRLTLIWQLSISTVAQQPGAQQTPAPAQTVPTQQQQSAQQQPSPTPPQKNQTKDEDVVRITTNLVQVDAVVTDKSGKPVTDLQPDEIRIFEDGRPQKITNFSYIVTGSPSSSPSTKPVTPVDKTAPPAPPVTLPPDQIRRTMALVVDDLGLSFESIYFVRRALKKFVDEQMRPGDLVAIIRTGGGIGALQQFTADKRQLYSAIERLKWNANGRSGINPFPSIEDNSGQSEEAQAANEELNKFREDLFAVGTLGAVRYVVDGLRELPGRKSILLISDGLKIYSRDDPTRDRRTQEALKRLIDRAGRASVVIYTMNATGLQTLGLTAADNTGERSIEQVQQELNNRNSAAFDSQEGLDFLARQTGGIAIKNTNDLGGGIRKVMNDQQGYYLIGFRPDESTFDPKTGRSRFHNLTGKVLRPGKYNFRTRNGFYGVSDDELKATASTPRQQIMKALISPFGAAGVHVRLTSLFANDAKSGSIMRSMLHVNGSDLTYTDEPDDWHKADFDVVALTFGDNGTLLPEPTNRTYTLRVRGPDYQRVLKEGFVYMMTVPIKKPGGYQLRAAVRDHGSERVGSASQFVEVPDIKKNRLTLSGIVITSFDPSALKKPAVPANATAGNPTATENKGEGEGVSDPRHSAAVRQFHAGEILDYGVVVYNARLDKSGTQPQLQLQVRLFRDGQPVFTGKEQPFSLSGPHDFKRLATAGGIQLGAKMVPGEYVLQIIVKDSLADEKHRVATQWIDFEIVK